MAPTPVSLPSGDLSRPLGVLAGGGDLPRRLVDHCQKTGRPVYLVAFHGHTDPATAEGVEHLWSRLAAAGEIISWLKSRGVVDLVMAGPVTRPSLKELRPDAKTAKFLFKIGKKAFGDDGLLSSMVQVLEEEEGFRVVGIDQVLGNLLAPVGLYGSHQPDEQARQDVARGIEVLRATAHLDIGQAVVIQEGVVLGIEAVEGTDQLLKRVAGLKRQGPGGVLVKLKKIQQEQRVDLPTIGLKTIEGAAAAGLRGIAIEAGGTLVVDQEAVAEVADAAGLFVEGLDLDLQS
ncbi:LpxI family protein [Rhodovibrionaceae bacterium A322]